MKGAGKKEGYQKKICHQQFRKQVNDCEARIYAI